MNTILLEFVDFNIKTAFKPITQNGFYQSIQQHAFDIIAIIAVVILTALIFVFKHARINPISYAGGDFMADVCAGFLSVFVGILPFIMAFITTHDLWPNTSNIIIIIFDLLLLLFWQIDRWDLLPKERRLKLINIRKSILVSLGTSFILLAGCVFLVNSKLNSENYTIMGYQNYISETE